MSKFTEFLGNLRQFDPVLIEAIEKGFNMIYEATEDVVSDIKEKVGTGEEISDELAEIESTPEVEPEVEPDVDELGEMPEEDLDIIA